MGSDPGAELPKVQDFIPKDESTNRKPDTHRCNICGLVALNNEELDDHVKHAHRNEDSNNKNNIYSDEQKINPFIKTDD